MEPLIPSRKPLGSSSVQVNTGMQPGLGGQQAQGTMAAPGYQSPGSLLRQYLGGAAGGGGATVAFNWKSHHGGLETSETLSKMLNGAEVEDKSTKEYYVDKVSQYMIHFSESIQRGKQQTLFYQHFLTVRDNFAVDQQYQQLCPVKKDFVDAVTKLHDFKRLVGFNGSVIFGYLLVEFLKATQADDWNEKDVHSAIQLACSHIMTFEFVNWLTGTKKGHSWHNRLPKNIDQALGNLDIMKDQFGQMWEFFDLPFPYANLSFVKTNSAPMEYHRIFNPEEYGDVFGRVPNQYNESPRSDPDSVYALVERNARMREGFVEEPRAYKQSARQSFEEVNTVIQTTRTDLENLNMANRHEFDLKRYFRPIGKENHYWMPESEWKNIQRVFRRHPDMKQEQGLAEGVFRIIQINLDHDDGWFTTIVRNEKLDVSYVLSNPSKLLPEMEKSLDEDEVYMVTATPIEVVDDGKLEVPVEKVNELGKGIPVIAVKEELVEQTTQALMTNIDLMTNRLVRNLKSKSAVSFNLAEWETYSLGTNEQHVKTRLWQDAAFLFNDRPESAEKVSMYEAGRRLQHYFEQNIIPEGLAKFINARLMNITNEWLVNVMGYNAVDGKGGGGKLQISNFVQDFEDLNRFLKEKDNLAYELFNDGTRENYLTKGLKIFYCNNPYGVDPEEMGALDKLKNDITLYVVREFFLVNVIGDKGPYYSEPNFPVYVRRSHYPEIFRMVEEAYEKTTENNFDTTDKLIRYGESGNVWLFSYTQDSRNVATLRHVSGDKPMVLLAMN